MKNRVLIDELPFEFNARVAIQLGRENISSSLVAIVELVKNAYDADAEEVSISFDQSENGEKIMLIEDNGHGMDLETLKHYWLRIGTDNKEREMRSIQKKRIVTGAKGLGRLGADRLGHRLVLQTKRAESEEVYEIDVDWRRYEQTQSAMSDIRHEIYELDQLISNNENGLFSTPGERGTRLCIYGLKDDWSKEMLTTLHQELALLVSPFGRVNDFSISMKTGISELDGKVSSDEMLDAAFFELEAWLFEKDNEYWVRTISKAHEGNKEEFIHPWRDWIKNTTDHQPSCGPLHFKLYYFKQEGNFLTKVNFDIPKIKKFLKSNRGIRIYRDDFRVKPYGDPRANGGDWLDLGGRRARSPGGESQPGWRIGPHQAIGALFINRGQNPNLFDQTNREGLVEGDAFSDMYTFVLKQVEFLETRVHKISKPKDPARVQREEKKQKAEDSKATARDAFKSFKEKIYRTPKPANDDQILEDFQKYVDDIEKVVEESQTRAVEYQEILIQEREQYESEKYTMANLASLGILSVALGHEAQGFSNSIKVSAAELKRSYDKGEIQLLNPHNENFRNHIDRIIAGTHFIDSFTRFSLENVKRDKRTRRLMKLEKVIQRVFDMMKQTLDKAEVDTSFSFDPNPFPEFKGFEIDWESIVVNLVTNSLAALETTRLSDRKIEVEARCHNETLHFVFSDSGCGLEAGSSEQIFEPMFSTKRNRKGDIIGTGMGLAIVKTFVEDHAGGTISVHSPGRLGGLDLAITIPVP